MTTSDLNTIQCSWLRMLTRDGADECWYFDHATHVVQTLFFDELGRAHIVSHDDPRESAIEQGSVHPQSVDAFNGFFDDLVGGLPSGQVELLFRPDGSQGYCWCRLSFKTTYSESGDPSCAIGLMYKLEHDDAPTFVHPAIPDTLIPHLLRMSVSDLRTDTMNVLIEQKGDQISLRRDLPLAEALRENASSTFRDGEAESYLSQLDPARLTALHDAGTRWSIKRYHIVRNGIIIDVRIAINVRRSAQGDLISYAYTSASDALNAWEADCSVAVERDPATDLYTRAYAQLVARSILLDGAASTSALGVVRFAGAVPLPDHLWNDLARALSVFLDTDCITYRFDEASLGVFFPSIDTGDAVERRLESAFRSARDSLVDVRRDEREALDALHIVAYVLSSTQPHPDLECMASSAYEACLGSAVPDEGDKVYLSRFPPMGAGQAAAQAVDPPSEELGALTSEELRACAVLLSKMLESGSASQCIATALQELGNYYKARRVYIAHVVPDQDTITLPYEWAAPNKAALKGLLSHSSAHRFPFIMHNISADHPVYVSRPRVYSHADDATPVQHIWRFCLVPITCSKHFALSLCVDNPAEHLDGWNLACVAARHIHRAWTYRTADFAQQLELGSRHATAAYGKEALGKLLGSIDNGAWSTLGVMVATIPHPADIVQDHGLAYALDAFKDVIDTLTRVFSDMPIFHTADTEFIALLPNSAYDAFIQRCARARSQLEASHPSDVALGSSWTDDVLGAWDAVNEARYIADTSNSMRPKPQDEGGPRAEARPAGEAAHALSPAFHPSPDRSVEDFARRFRVYVQPKIDNRTGELVGGEALCRVIGSNGRAISPVQEIQRLEAQGTIHDLDYHVFDQTLELMSRWKDEYGRAVPLSTNFSRATLLNQRALASILAIRSHFPELDDDAIEIELTESAVDLGKINLIHLVDRYHSAGLSVALDDFGSHYSNVAVLANVRFDTIKLDRSIISGLPGNPVSRSIVKSIAEICADQHMACVAEGVETSAQVGSLAHIGCHVCQGFFYDKALPPELFAKKYLDSTR